MVLWISTRQHQTHRLVVTVRLSQLINKTNNYTEYEKIIYSMMALAMTTTVFTSCEDVPAPYSVTFEENNNNNTNTPTTPTAGTGTEADPFNVAAALKYIDAGQNLG